MEDIKKELKKDSHFKWSDIKFNTRHIGAYFIIAVSTLGTPDFAQAKERNEDNPSNNIEYSHFPTREIDYQVDTLSNYNHTLAYFMKNKQTVTQNYYKPTDINSIQKISTLAHEQKHRDNSTFDLPNTPMSLEQQYKCQCHNEISANIVELLQLRQMYIEAQSPKEQSSIKEVMSENFPFYVKALEDSTENAINPFSISPTDFDKEMTFISTSIKDNWMQKTAKYYNQTHLLVVLGTFSIHNYNTLKENNKNYQNYLEHIYTIGGIDFNKYLGTDIYCYSKKIKDAQNLIEQNAPRNKVEEKISGEPNNYTILDKYYKPLKYTTYIGDPIYPEWSEQKRVSEVQNIEIYDFSGEGLKQYRDYLTIAQSNHQNQKKNLKFAKRLHQRTNLSKKEINLADITYVITPDML